MSFGNFIKKLFSEKHKKRKEVHSSFSNFLRAYFTFHQNEKNGIFALLILILFFTVATLSYRVNKSQAVADTTELQKQLDEFIASAAVNTDIDSAQGFIAQEISSPSKPPAQLFTFNPNTTTLEEFVKLGLTQKQATGILNYRNKGGKFRKTEDFAKMYTISKEMYERLEPFIVIPEEQPKEHFYADKKVVFEKKEYPPKQTVLVEINTADSLELIKVRGIGPYIAMKIIELRTKLGGFHSKEQLREVYRVDSARYVEIEPFLTVDPFEVKKININTATLDQLKAHPYIRYNIANSIVSIRQQHGRFSSIEGIRKSHLVTEDVMRKIAPYLTVE
jgi:DNA uptake protein ComE-like DNA-binding protein